MADIHEHKLTTLYCCDIGELACVSSTAQAIDWTVQKYPMKLLHILLLPISVLWCCIFVWTTEVTIKRSPTPQNLKVEVDIRECLRIYGQISTPKEFYKIVPKWN
jgi:hypothetical protein